MEYLAKIISVFIISSVKFIAGPPLAYAYSFNFFETVLFTASGGMTGVFLIAFYDKKIVQIWSWCRVFWMKIFQVKPKMATDSGHHHHRKNKNGNNEKHEKKAVSEKKETHQDTFIHKNRRVVWIWKHYGLIGIALFTPVLLSIPIGTFVAARLVHNKKKILLYLFISVLFWSVILASLIEVYQVVSWEGLQTELFFN